MGVCEAQLKLVKSVESANKSHCMKCFFHSWLHLANFWK